MSQATTGSEIAVASPENELRKAMVLIVHDLEQNVDALRLSYPAIMDSVENANVTCFDRLRAFLISNRLGTVRDGNPEIIDTVTPFPREHWMQYRQLVLDVDKTKRSHVSLSRSFLVSLLSVFDLFIAAIFRFILRRVPGILKDKEAMSFEKLTSFHTIEEATLFVVVREVDALLRDSRDGQFRWLEAKLKIDLRKDDKLWADLVELEQRRHTFVHCDGQVTEEYLEQCRKHRVSLPLELQIGNRLSNTDEYFAHACQAVLESAIKVAQVVWRKLLPEDTNADNEFVNLCFFRIVAGEYRLAIRLIRSAHDELHFKFYSQDAEYKSLLNLAQSYKWSGDEEGCKGVLSSRDFSATKPLYRLGKCCLEENWPQALALVEEIGPRSPDLEAANYRDWPIFRGLRERTEFLELFEKLFGSPLLVAEVVHAVGKRNEMRSQSQ